MTDDKSPLGFNALQAESVAAFPETAQLAIAFEPAEDERGIVVMLPAAAVGPMVAEIISEFKKLAMSRADRAGVMLPMNLTGARPFGGESGSSVLLLQLDQSIELPIVINPRIAEHLLLAIQQTVEPGGSSPPRRQ